VRRWTEKRKVCACRRYQSWKHRNSGIDTIKDEANPRSNESKGRKRQALADKKDTEIRKQCIEKSKTKQNIDRVYIA